MYSTKGEIKTSSLVPGADNVGKLKNLMENGVRFYIYCDLPQKRIMSHGRVLTSHRQVWTSRREMWRTTPALIKVITCNEPSKLLFYWPYICRVSH